MRTCIHSHMCTCMYRTHTCNPYIHRHIDTYNSVVIIILHICKDIHVFTYTETETHYLHHIHRPITYVRHTQTQVHRYTHQYICTDIQSCLHRDSHTDACTFCCLPLCRENMPDQPCICISSHILIFGFDFNLNHAVVRMCKGVNGIVSLDYR